MLEKMRQAGRPVTPRMQQMADALDKMDAGGAENDVRLRCLLVRPCHLLGLHFPPAAGTAYCSMTAHGLS